MPLRILFFILFFPPLFFSSPETSAQTIVVWSEDFETNGDSIRYLTSNKFRDTCNDHFILTDGSNICTSSSNCTGSTTYSGFNGTSYWSGEDQNDIGSGGDELSVKSILFNSLDVTLYDNLIFSGLFGAGNECGNFASTYDAADYIHVYYNADNMGWILGMSFESESNGGDETNEPLSRDTDFDGIGDGVELTNTLISFSFPIPYSKTLQLKIETSMDADKEEIAFDFFQLKGDTVICVFPDTPTLQAFGNTGCPSQPSTLSIVSGSLNSATQWTWYTGSCTGIPIGTGTSIDINPAVTSTYFVRGEGYCVSPGSCQSIEIVAEDLTPPVISCPADTTVYLDSSCQSLVPDFSTFISS